MISIDGGHMSGAHIVAAARRQDRVTLTSEARARATRSYELADRVSRERRVYGRSTGVGANRDVVMPGSAAQSRSLLRSHATSAGQLRSPERVRAMLVVRLNQLAAGGSGSSPALLDALLDMIAADALPAIREHGSIGTGDLPALATTALALAGEAPTDEPMPSVFEFGAHDALSFISSNAATIGDAALACADLQVLGRACVVVAALTFSAVEGNPEAFAAAVERVTPFEGSRQVCRWMRSLTDSGATPARIQDPFGLRTFPQVHGPVFDSLSQLDAVIGGLANAPSENPVWLPSDDNPGELAHHGGFHAAYLATALDTSVSTVAQSASLVLSRLAILNEPSFTRLPAFLGDGTPGASGVMTLEYVAASALGEIRSAASPAASQSVVLSRGVEEHASFASMAARQLASTGPNLQMMLACELVAAVRALRLRHRSLVPGLADVMAAYSILSADTADRDLSPDIEMAETLLPQLAELL
ncbi:MAG: aromatic amino acid lyase [Propionibacteriales bacterium]|nr:aromatic amino acid lyase [Propionibacteriales bacterium]